MNGTQEALSHPSVHSATERYVRGTLRESDSLRVPLTDFTGARS